MSHSRLMCVWHAAYVRDAVTNSGGGLKKDLVKAVTLACSEQAGAEFSESEFDSIFPDDKSVNFIRYKEYGLKQLFPTGSEETPNSLDTTLEHFEKSCWKDCAMACQPKTMRSDEDRFHFWQAFNRLSVEGSYPPSICQKTTVPWILRHFARLLKVHYKPYEPAFPKSDASAELAVTLTLQRLLSFLETNYFTGLGKTTKIHEAVTELHDLVILERQMCGWLHKRTRKQNNWTSWQHRWMELVAGKLIYYEADEKLEEKKKKGEVLVDANSTVESLDKYAGIRHKLAARLKVSNIPYFEIELGLPDEKTKDMWVTAIGESIRAAKAGVSILEHYFSRRFLEEGKPQAEGDASNISTDAGTHPSEYANGNHSSSSSVNSSPEMKRKSSSRKRKITRQIFPKVEDFDKIRGRLFDQEEFDSNFLNVEKEKIEGIFLQIDKNGNGLIDKAEFNEFVTKGLNLNLDQKELDLIFNIADSDRNGVISFNEFYRYFVKFICDETVNSAAEARLRAAFLKADRDGTATVNFREFSEFISARRQSINVQRLYDIFDRMDKDHCGEVSYDQFRSFIQRQSSLTSLAIGSTPPVHEGTQNATGFFADDDGSLLLEKQLRAMYLDSDVQQLAGMLRNRWEIFASFRRTGGPGELVMTGGSGMVADVLPGDYNLVDLICFNDLPPLEPKHVTISGARWITSQTPGQSGMLVFPSDFDGCLPVDIATNEHLAYYGAALADSNQTKISLLYRHGVQDFTYQNNYLDEYVRDARKLGGSGVERHPFSHLDTPLEDDSGYFVMGKLVGKELKLTAFKVPTRHTLYLPGNVIHSNDYLKGTWRTMLSDEAEIDHVQLVRSNRRENVTEMEHFAFTFQR